jgi:hypothetical protein
MITTLPLTTADTITIRSHSQVVIQGWLQPFLRIRGEEIYTKPTPSGPTITARQPCLLWVPYHQPVTITEAGSDVDISTRSWGPST